MENFSYEDKEIKNEFTIIAKYALISKTANKALADCKVKANIPTYANVLKYDNDHSNLEFFAAKSNGRMQVIETRKLEAL